MFGNSELKETKLKLDIAINIATEIFTGMDPVMRPFYLKKYKSMVDYYDRIRGSYTFTSDISNDRDRKHVEENKEIIAVLRKVVKQVELELAEEEFEGSSYGSNIGIPYDISIDKNSLYNRLRKLLSENFPGLYQIEEKDKEELKEKKNDDLLSSNSYEKSLETKASEIINELTTEDVAKEEFKKEEYGTSEYPTDIKAYYQAIFYQLMYRQVVLNKKGTPMSNATRCSIQLICDYVTPLNEDKDGAYSSPKFLLSFKEKITNIKTFIIWMDAKIRENLDGLKIGDSEDDFYRTPQDFINDIDPNEIIDILTIAWENSKDEVMMTKIRLFEKDVKEKWIDSE